MMMYFVVVVLCGMAPGGYHIEQRENAANLGLEALYLWSLMASLATLISNSRTLGKPRSPAAGLSAWKSTKLLDVGMHPNVQVSVQGQLVFQAQLSKTFLLVHAEVH